MVFLRHIEYTHSAIVRSNIIEYTHPFERIIKRFSLFECLRVSTHSFFEATLIAKALSLYTQSYNTADFVAFLLKMTLQSLYRINRRCSFDLFLQCCAIFITDAGRLATAGGEQHK